MAMNECEIDPVKARNLSEASTFSNEKQNKVDLAVVCVTEWCLGKGSKKRGRGKGTERNGTVQGKGEVQGDGGK